MDFKADECRLVIVTTLPRAINTQEEFISAYLRDSGFMRSRLNQRLVQALGRCNRSDEDYGVYVLADRRFSTHFGRESNRAGLPRNMIAEIDLAQDWAEIEVSDLVARVEAFMDEQFGEYDAQLSTYLAGVPAQPPSQPAPDTASEEVLGWAALYNQNYSVASDTFEQCWETARAANLLEIGAFHGWHWAKAVYLQSLLGEPGARDKALAVFEQAIDRGGRSAWFNRMRASVNRARATPGLLDEATQEAYAAILFRTFDDLLEKLGTTGQRFERYCNSVSGRLESTSHAEFQEGLEKLGNFLGFTASRPTHGAATDCRWRGIFGNTREVITFEAKIEHSELNRIVSSDIGQAHNQKNRAEAEYSSQGFAVRGTIVTHLTDIAPEAKASLGELKIIRKGAVIELWERLKGLLSIYRDRWALDDLSARLAAAQAIRQNIPAAGWMLRALDLPDRVISSEQLLAEWRQ